MRRWLLFTLALVFAASVMCTKPATIPSTPADTSSPVPPTATLSLETLRVEVFNGDPARDDKIGGAHVAIADQNHVTDGAGNTAFSLWVPNRYTVTVTADGFEPWRADDVDLPRAGALLVSLTPLPPLPPLHVDGTTFRTPDGTIWKWHGATAFLAYKQFLDNQLTSLTAYLKWARSHDINVVRVLGMEGWAGRAFIPGAYGDRYYTSLVPFARLLASEGLRLEFVVFADAQITGLNTLAARRAHLARVITALRGEPTVFLEIANEPFKNLPGGDAEVEQLTDLTVGSGLLCAGGNSDVETPCVPTPGGQCASRLFTLDYVTLHPSRDDEWPRKAMDALELSKLGWDGFTPPNKPVILDEPMGIGAASGSRSLNARDFFDFFALADLVAAGATIHGDFAIDVRLPNAEEQACVDAAQQAWRLVPPEAQLGSYARGGLDTSPLDHTDAPTDLGIGALRTYCMALGAVSSCVVVRPEANWRPAGRKGWTVVVTGGGRHNVVQLSKAP